MKKSLFLLVLTLLIGCRSIETPDGVVPEEYMGEVSEYLGEYTGAFVDEEGSLNVFMDSNRPSISVSGFYSDDLIGENCGSSIGLLQRINLNRSKEVESFVFLLNSGSCFNQDPYISFKVIENAHGLYLRASTEWMRIPDSGDDRGGRRPDRVLYRDGVFRKI